MEIQKAQKKSFDVEVVEVTSSNMPEVAAWAGGEVGTEESGTQYVDVDDKNAFNARQAKAFVGDLVVKHVKLNTFKAFSKKSFGKAFDYVVPNGIPHNHDVSDPCTAVCPVYSEPMQHDRSSVTGKYVSPEEAAANPDTTVHETDIPKKQEVVEVVRELPASELPGDASL